MPKFRVLGTGARYWAYLLVLTPAVTDWIEIGRPPTTPRSFLTELVVGGLIAACIFIIQRNQRRLEQLATTDSLTGLNNRHRFIDDVSREVAIAHRLGSRLALIYVDVDGFKAVNDNFGHSEGDRVLREVAALLRSSARREVDQVYRVGGDEFALLLPGMDAAQGEWLLQTIDRPPPADYPTIARHHIRLSRGGADLGSAETPDGLIGRADHSMYANKYANRPDREARAGAERTS